MSLWQFAHLINYFSSKLFIKTNGDNEETHLGIALGFFVPPGPVPAPRRPPGGHGDY